MRRIRWLFLAAIPIIVIAVAATYYGRMTRMKEDAPPPPKPLKSGIDATAEGWHYRKMDSAKGNCPVVEVTAKNFQQVQEPSSYELEGVGLKLYHGCGKTFDEVKSAKAQFDISTGVLYSDGEVEIVRGLPAEGEPKGRVVNIKTSGVHFETKGGKAYTDRPATFTFEHGDGKAVGAEYDPENGTLNMKSQAEVNWQGKRAGSLPMKIEAGSLIYLERDQKIQLTPWARMTRDKLKVEGANATVTLVEQVARKIEAANAKGVQDDPGRKVEYSAEQLVMDLNEDGAVTKVVGERNAHLVSTTDSGQTEVTSARIDLDLTPGEKDSTLDRALATGNAVVEARPVQKPGVPPNETRTLKSESVELRMRAGGKEIDHVDTLAPGTLEFTPNRSGQPHRFLKGDQFHIAYAADNQIQSFHAVNVNTRTENPPKKPGEPNPPALTSSRELMATFDPKTHQMVRLDQNADFRYEQGDRKARADKATLDQPRDTMILTGGARTSDPTGSLTADRITMNQKSGDVAADGHVSSTRLPDKKGGTSAMLSNDEPTQAKADHMTSTDSNLQIHYEGNAVAWQGANRIEADRLDIDRDEGVLKADGHVSSQFVDKPKKGKDGKPLPASEQRTVFTIVKAPAMVYTDEDRIAHYKGGATLSRPNMNVKAREIKAFLKDSTDNSDSSLDHAFADGGVVIVQAAKDRTRTGTSEHAEYYAGEEKIILEKGQPKMVDTLHGVTTGRQLIYFANDDRLLVNGVPSERAESVIHRK